MTTAFRTELGLSVCLSVSTGLAARNYQDQRKSRT